MARKICSMTRTGDSTISTFTITYDSLWNPNIDGYLWKLDKTASGVFTKLLNGNNFQIDNSSATGNGNNMLIISTSTLNTSSNTVFNLLDIIFFRMQMGAGGAGHYICRTSDGLMRFAQSPQAYTELYKPESAPQNIELTFNALQNITSITDGETQQTSFPAIYTVNKDTTFTINGKNNPIVTVTNKNNMKQIQVGQNIHSTFPVVLNIQSDTIIEASGEDDKIITVNTTNTKPPVITNT